MKIPNLSEELRLAIEHNKYTDSKIDITKPRFCGLKLPSFCLEYLINFTAWPLGCIYVITGLPSTYKSTFAVEIVRWHINNFGLGIFIDTEGYPPVLLPALLQKDTDKVYANTVTSMEAWQTTISTFLDYFQDRYKDNRSIPICYVVDSVTSALEEHTLQNISKSGAASMRYPRGPKLLADYVRGCVSRFTGWPFSMILVMHLRQYRDMGTGRIEESIPGGWTIQYCQSLGLTLNKVKPTVQYVSRKETVCSLTVFKNKWGPEKRRIHVPFIVYEEDPPRAIFDWKTSTTLLLAEGAGLRSSESSTIMKKIANVIDIHTSKGGRKGTLYWSNRLKISNKSAVSPSEFGNAIDENEEVKKELRQLFGIRQVCEFVPGKDIRETLDKQ